MLVDYWNLHTPVPNDDIVMKQNDLAKLYGKYWYHRTISADMQKNFIEKIFQHSCFPVIVMKDCLSFRIFASFWNVYMCVTEMLATVTMLRAGI